MPTRCQPDANQMPRGMRSNATQDANKMPHRGYAVHTCMPEGILGYSSPSDTQAENAKMKNGCGQSPAPRKELCRGARAHGDLKRQADARPAHPPSCTTRLAMAITDLFEDSSSNRHDGVYLAYYFLGTSLRYIIITSGKLKRLRKAKHVAKT